MTLTAWAALVFEPVPLQSVMQKPKTTCFETRIDDEILLVG